MEEKTQEQNEVNKTEQEAKQPKLRQIIIETDGNQIRVTKNETAGKFEFIAIMESLANFAKGN